MWQFFIVFYFIFGATNYLLRRVLAQKFGDSNRLINTVFFVCFLLPTAIILSFFFPHDLNIGLLNVAFVLGGSIIWPLLNIASFRANQHVDVGIYAIISNLSPLFTLMVALPFLHEQLQPLQLLGILLLLFSGVIAGSSQLYKKHRASKSGLLWCLISAAILGIAIAFESFMLHRMDFGAYLIYGWGAQVVWMVILAGKEVKKLPGLFRKSMKTTRILLIWGATNVLKSVMFILALKISGSSSIISATTDFMSVAVVIAAYFFLKEKEHMLQKWLGAGIGIAGLLLITK
jgi:drug/metabolite transporter (DMT)-like permease